MAQRDRLSVRLREAIESIWSPPPDGCATDFHFHFLNPSDRLTAISRVKSVSTTSASNIAQLVNNWEDTKRRLEDVRRKWDSVQDIQPRLRETKERLDELNARVGELNNQRSERDIREQGFSTELADLKAGIAQMEERKEKRGPEESRIELAERVREVLRELEEN